MWNEITYTFPKFKAVEVWECMSIFISQFIGHCDYLFMGLELIYVSKRGPGWLGTGESFNSLWPGNAIWQRRCGSTLAQVMACCLIAPSHYLTNIDLSSLSTCGIQLWAILQEMRKIYILDTSFKKIDLILQAHPQGPMS